MANSKYDREGGIHRVPMWRIAGFALNNTSTNLYLCLMNFVAYYLTGIVGVLVVTASSFSMFMRIWDGVTDPFIGYVVDKTNGKFGKNRPFMIIGNLILLVTSWILFHVTGKLPQNTAVRFAFFIVVAAIYYIGYTFQCVVTKSAQTCLTNDPKQRPTFAIFDAIYNVALFSFIPALSASLAKKHGGFTNEAIFHDLWAIIAPISLLFCIIAIISIWPKDNEKYFGTSKPVKVNLKDYWETLKNNRAIQMLVVAASTDKLAGSAKTAAVTVVMFGVVVGNYAINAKLTPIISMSTMLITMVLIGSLATNLGQRKALLIGSWGGIIVNSLLALLWIFGNPASMNSAENTLVWSSFTVAHVVLSIICGGVYGLAGNIVIPMTADCADYEVYRSGRYLPGFMGTLFSFVDKLISSLAPMIAGLMFAAIGFKEKLPDIGTPYSTSLRNVGVFLTYGIVIIGLIFNLIAMKFYPLTKEKMAEIQSEIAAIKAKYAEENK